MLFTKAIEQEYLKHEKKFFLIFQIIVDHFLKGFYDLSQALDQCKTNIGNTCFISPLVKKFLNHNGNNYLNFAQTSHTPDLVHVFPSLFPRLPSQDHLLREEL